MADAAIWTEQLTKSYPKVEALRGLNLCVARGTVYGFLGRSGAGKTTTMRILLGLARAHSGDARVLGFDVMRDSLPILQRTAFVSDRKTLYDWMTGRELLRFARSFYPTWDKDAADRYCRVFEVPLDRPITGLSHGNRTKLSLTAALAQRPELLMLDEPTEGLDPVVQDAVLRVIIDDHVSEGKTVFFSSHHLAVVEQIADWVGIIDAGRVLLESPLDAVRNDFRVVIATGRALPARLSTQVLSITEQDGQCKYTLTREAESFVADLQAGGATILHSSPLTLREVFLELVRKEESCTSGNCGVTAAPVC